MSNIIMANNNYQALKVISWQKAAQLIVCNEAFNLDFSNVVKTIRSQKMEINLHRIIIAKTSYYPNHNYGVHDLANKRTILNRDNYTCAYCGQYGNTVDHIVPKAHGGQSTYINQVAACKKCNSKKADKKLEESGLTLLKKPTLYDKLTPLREEVNTTLQKAMELVN